MDGFQEFDSAQPAQQAPMEDLDPIPATANDSDRPPRTPRWRRWSVAGLAGLTLMAGAGVAGGMAVSAVDNHATSTSSAAGTSVTTVSASTTSLTAMIAAVQDQIVAITVNGASGSDAGSGVVVRSDGTILTNNHVVSAAAQGGTITVTLASGKTAPATIVSTDAAADLALIKAQGLSGLTAATLADSGSVQVGDSVVAIGNELGLSGSASEGIVSALHRSISVGGQQSTSPFGQTSQSSGTTYADAIQTDAAINEGDSGGALFNTAGQVIGITSAIATGSSGGSGSVGIGFAIPSSTVAQFLNQSL